MRKQGRLDQAYSIKNDTILGRRGIISEKGHQGLLRVIDELDMYVVNKFHVEFAANKIISTSSAPILRTNASFPAEAVAMTFAPLIFAS